jgi:hypothetical protein
MDNLSRGRALPLFIIYFLITALSLGALFITVWFSRTSYSSLVDFITQTLKRPDLKPLIVKSLFTYQKYKTVYNVHWFFYPLIIITSLVLYSKSRLIDTSFLAATLYIKSSFSHVRSFFKTLQHREKLLLSLGCGLYILLVLYNDHLKEISYDEAWGYNYYINKPFYFPLILFNTYPLFNIITHIFTFLPFDTLINIRLPSLLFGLLTLLALSYTLRNYSGFLLAGLGILILTASPLFYIYSSLSRGITLSLFLAVIVLHVTLQLVEVNTEKERYLFLYTISNILGIASMPTFLVYTAATFLFIIYCQRKQKSFLKAVLANTSIIVVISAIFYLPVILSSGSSLIYHNNRYEFDVADTTQQLISFLFGISQLFFVSKYIVISLLFISVVLLFLKQPVPVKKPFVFLSLFIIGFTLFARAVTGNIFPERSLNFLILCFIILSLWIISTLLNRSYYTLKVTLTISLFFLCAFAYIHNQKELFVPAEDKDAKIIGELLIKNDIKTAYINEEEFWFRVPMIEYYYSREHKDIRFATSDTASTRYQPFDINNNYDCIVCKSSSCVNINSSYKEIYRNNNFVLWKRL